MSSCASCRMRKKYDENPKSFVGRIWKWHISFCPGWKKYMQSLPESERKELSERYGL